MLRQTALRAILIVGALGIGGLATTLAFAGNIYLTGHDLDFHCDSSTNALFTQCNALGIAVDVVRKGAPDPTKPVLVLDRGTEVATSLGNSLTKAQNSIEGTGNAFPFTVEAPTSSTFASETLSPSKWSAIAIASDTTCGGCDNNLADATAINTRTSALQSFFNSGGGLLYLAGANERATYYASVPIPATSVAVTAPFTVTSFGSGIGGTFGTGPGLTNADANCCATHNSFTIPDPSSPLKVAELDSAGFAETLVGVGASIGGGGFTPGPGGTSVPEPSPLILLGTSLLGVAGFRRFRGKLGA